MKLLFISKKGMVREPNAFLSIHCYNLKKNNSWGHSLLQPWECQNSFLTHSNLKSHQAGVNSKLESRTGYKMVTRATASMSHRVGQTCTYSYKSAFGVRSPGRKYSPWFRAVFSTASYKDRNQQPGTSIPLSVPPQKPINRGICWEPYL